MGWSLGDVATGAQAIRRACWPKVAHPDREGAVQHLQAQARVATRGDDERLNVFACPHCHAWHVGHSRNNRVEDSPMQKSYYDPILRRDVELDEDRAVVKGDAMRPGFFDFLNDTAAARTYRAQHPLEKQQAVPDPPRAVREIVDAALVTSRGAVPATELADRVFTNCPEAYAAYRAETTVGTDGRRLSEQGQPVATSAIDLEADISRRVGAIIAKADVPVTWEAALHATFAADPDLYRRWRDARLA